MLRRHRIATQKELKEVFKLNAKEYCKKTSLHGLMYLKNNDLYMSEKVFFFIAFLIVILLTIYYTFNVYWKWSLSSPMIVSTNPQQSLINDHPFPAVTICNLNQVYKSKVGKFAINSAEYVKVQLLCQKGMNISVENVKNWNDMNIFIKNNSQPCSKMMRSCRYGGVFYNCTDIFTDSITDEGLCCTFNMVHPYFMYHSRGSRYLHLSKVFTKGFEPVRWSVEKGYDSKLPEKFYPQKAVGTGVSLGLSVVLDVEADEYYCSSMNHVGFKVLLHNPTEMPSMDDEGLLLSPGYETRANIVVEKTGSDETLRNIDVRYRYCYFEDEYPLDLFSEYTKRNCEAECVAKTVHQMCGCVRHYMPRKTLNATTCSIAKTECVEKAKLRSYLKSENRKDCYDICLPSCSDTSYFTDFFAAPLNLNGFGVSNNLLENMSAAYVKRNIGVLHVFYKKMSYATLIQTELVSPTDFLSNIGGIICLFMGFSFITITEILFYGIIRPGEILWRWKKHALQTPQHSEKMLKRSLEQKLLKRRQFENFSQRKLHIMKDYTSTQFFCTIAQRVERKNLENSKNLQFNDMPLQWID